MTIDLLSITADPKVDIPVDLIGVRYEVKSPKAGLALRIAVEAKAAGDDPQKMLDAIETWILMAFGKKNAPKVMARLDNPDDDLDILHIMKLMEKLIERSTALPPTSPPA